MKKYRLAEKVVMLTILVASIGGLAYWLHATDKKEQEYNSAYSRNLGLMTMAKIELFNTKTADLDDLEEFDESRQALGISLASLGISDKQMKEAAQTATKNEYRNRAYRFHEILVAHGFDLWTYTKMRESAKLGGVTVKELFAEEGVRVEVNNYNDQLLYHDGWRQPTPEETQLFQALKAKERAERMLQKVKDQLEDIRVEITRQQCLQENPPKYFLVGNFPEIEFKPEIMEGDSAAVVSVETQKSTLHATIPVKIGEFQHFNIRIQDQCEVPYRMRLTVFGDDDSQNWKHDEEGYKVKTFVDIAPILASDGLKVVKVKTPVTHWISDYSTEEVEDYIITVN